MKPDVVLVLTRTDLSTLIAAIDTRDSSLLRMTDGSTPTSKERGLIMSAEADDYKAASNVVRLGADFAIEAAEATKRVRGLLRKYSSGDPTTTVANVWDRMTPEDREIFSASEQLIHLADEIGTGSAGGGE